MMLTLSHGLKSEGVGSGKGQQQLLRRPGEAGWLQVLGCFTGEAGLSPTNNQTAFVALLGVAGVS